MKRLISVLLLSLRMGLSMSLCLIFITGCGQKGPLVAPPAKVIIKAVDTESITNSEQTDSTE